MKTLATNPIAILCRALTCPESKIKSMLIKPAPQPRRTLPLPSLQDFQLLAFSIKGEIMQMTNETEARGETG